MLDFKPAQPLDRQWALPLLEAEAIPLCDYSFTVLYCWQNVYAQKICRFEDRLLVHANAATGSAYLWPVGKGDPVPALNALEAHAKALGEPLRLVAVLEEHRAVLEGLYPGRVEWTPSPENYDYLYEVNRLADLPGKKLHAKRNHIHRLDEHCPGWTYAPLTAGDVADCLELDKRWYEEHVARTPDRPELESLLRESAALSLALRHLEELGLDGGVIRYEGEVLAFTLGSILTPTVYDVHFERARADLQGVFPAINREFSRWIRANYPNVAYINREEDAGIEGLRKAKLSYGPDHLVENFCVEIKAAAE